MKLCIAATLALVFGAITLSAQEKKAECCGAADFHALFCGAEKCDNAGCKAACDKAGALLKSVGAKMMELAKKEFGDKACECCEKSDVKPCAKCQEFCKTVVIPNIKERLMARCKDSSKEFKHSVKGADGKTTEVACTFLKADTCANCVNEVSETSFAKMKELMSKKEEPKK